MKEELISFETAVLAKEKGFNEYCRYRYDKPSNNLSSWPFHEADEESWHDNSSCVGESAPTQSLLQKWLREEYGFHVDIVFNNGTRGYNYLEFYEKCAPLASQTNHSQNTYDTYEQALEEGLKEALKLL